jgi:hypothetical protein
VPAVQSTTSAQWVCAAHALRANRLLSLHAVVRLTLQS